MKREVKSKMINQKDSLKKKKKKKKTIIKKNEIATNFEIGSAWK